MHLLTILNVRRVAHTAKREENTSLVHTMDNPVRFGLLTNLRRSMRYCDGGPLGAEIFGRCQHPIVAGSGTGVFNGVTGQMNFKDDIEAGNFPYRGQLRF